MIYILLSLLIVIQGINTYLMWKNIPRKQKDDILRSVYGVEESKVIEYIPPQDEEIEMSRNLTEEITRK